MFHLGGALVPRTGVESGATLLGETQLLLPSNLQGLGSRLGILHEKITFNPFHSSGGGIWKGEGYRFRSQILIDFIPYPAIYCVNAAGSSPLPHESKQGSLRVRWVTSVMSLLGSTCQAHGRYMTDDGSGVRMAAEEPGGHEPSKDTPLANSRLDLFPSQGQAFCSEASGSSPFPAPPTAARQESYLQDLQAGGGHARAFRFCSQLLAASLPGNFC